MLLELLNFVCFIFGIVKLENRCDWIVLGSFLMIVLIKDKLFFNIIILGWRFLLMVVKVLLRIFK